MPVRFRSGLAATLCVLAVVIGTAAPATADPAGPDDIYRILGVDQLPAEYVVLVDVSGSMQAAGLYAPLKTALRGFFAALAPDDDVDLITFADRPRELWHGPAGGSPDAIIAKLPAKADGAHTDLGLALESAVHALARPGARAIASVILLTDGKHDPRPGSRYPLEQGYAWDQLRKSAASLPQTKLAAFGIPLAGRTSVGLLGKVFGPAASILPVGSVDDVTARLAQPKAAVRAAKARDRLHGDLAAPVSVSWPAIGRTGSGPHDVRVTLRSGAAYVPLVVSSWSVAGCPGARASVPDAAPVTLPPGGMAVVTVRLDWDAGPRSWAPTDPVSLRCVLRLDATVDTVPVWSLFIANDIGETFAPGLSGPDAPVEFSAERGSLGRWEATGLVLLALVGVGLLALRRRQRPALTGVLSATPTFGSSRSTVEIPLHGRQMTISASSAGLPGAGQLRGVRSPGGRSDLQIEYSRDGSSMRRATDRCPAGGSVTVSGVIFNWRAGG